MGQAASGSQCKSVSPTTLLARCRSHSSETCCLDDLSRDLCDRDAQSCCHLRAAGTQNTLSMLQTSAAKSNTKRSASTLLGSEKCRVGSRQRCRRQLGTEVEGVLQKTEGVRCHAPRQRFSLRARARIPPSTPDLSSCSFSTCCFGTTSVCPGTCGNLSRNAMTCESSKTI